jgi:hypothetical protein
MDFSHRKLPLSQAPSLKQSPISEVKPYELTLAPVYVFLKRNERFVAVKAPMDFFLPEELERLQPLVTVFIPKFVDEAMPFQTAARRVKALLEWTPVLEDEIQLPPPPYALSDAILRVVGPLWSAPAKIEPYFVSVFVNELCQPIPPELLKATRDQSVEILDRAIFRSSLAVFLALHLGYVDLSYLSWLREHAFREVASGINHRHASVETSSEIAELLSVVSLAVSGSDTRVIDGIGLGRLEGRVAQRLDSRIQRIIRDMVNPAKKAPTIVGPGGLLVA